MIENFGSGFPNLGITIYFHGKSRIRAEFRDRTVTQATGGDPSVELGDLDEGAEDKCGSFWGIVVDLLIETCFHLGFIYINRL